MTWRAGSSRFVGRSTEIDLLQHLLQEVVTRRHGQLALVTGEAGVGKTRLAGEFATLAAAAGTTVLVGRAVPGGDPYRPLTEALAGALRGRPAPNPPGLRPYLPALGALLPGLSPRGSRPGGRIVLGEAVLRLVSALAGAGGALLVLEDTHWADPDTLDILSYLSHAADATPLFVLLTARDDRDTPQRLYDVVTACSAPVLALDRLHRTEVRSLIESCLSGPPPTDLVDFVVEHSDGVPFLAEELLSGLASVGALTADGRLTGPLTPSVPRTFAATVRRRLETLEPPARRVVEAAAVLGRRFDWRLLPAMTGGGFSDTLTGLRAVVATGLVEAENSETFRFRHALTCDAVRSEMLPPDLAALARAGAEAVQAAQPDACELAAGLWASGGREGQAAALYVRAGQQARRRGALQTAGLLLRRAIALAGDEPAVRNEAEHALLEVLAATGQTDAALALGERLLASGETLVRLTLAEVAVEAGRWQLAADQLEEVFTDCPRVGVLAARIAHESGDPDAARTVAEKTLEAAREEEAWPVACEALEVIGRAARLTDLGAAREAFAEAERLAAAHALPVERVSALHELGTIDLLANGSIDQLTQARTLAAEAGLLALVATLDVQIAAALIHRDPSAALGYAECSARLAQRLRMDRLRATALFFAAAVHADARRTGPMECCIAESLALAPEDHDVNAGIWGAVRAQVALLADDIEAAGACLDIAMEHLRGNPTTTPAPTRGLWALVRTVQDRDAVAARQETAPATVNWENQALLGYAEAVACGRRGAVHEAEERFSAADAAMARLPWWQQRVRMLLADDALADCWGDPVQWANEALAVFRARGDDRLVARARAVLQRAGAPIPRTGRGSTPVPDSLAPYLLTSREMDVLSLAAEGLSNSAIARRLVVSPRTVETHMSHLRTKTGTGSRGELVAILNSGGSQL